MKVVSRESNIQKSSSGCMGFGFEGFLNSPVIGSLYSLVRKEGFGGIKRRVGRLKKQVGEVKTKG